MKRILVAAILVVLLSANVYALTLSVLPNETSLSVGNTFQVDIMADIAQSEAVIGWGLDFGYDQTILSLIGLPTINSALWTPGFAPDGDGLAALNSFMSPPVYGENLLLATLDMQCISTGASILEVGYTIGDFTEGFPLPFPPGGFVTDIDYNPSSVEVSAGVSPVPEPTTFILLSSGLVGLATIRRRNKIYKNSSRA